MGFSFLHAADIHLDSPLRGLERYEGAPVAEVRLATRRALANLVDFALAERVAFVLVAGDLYDGDWHDYNTGLYFCREMIRLREDGIPVYLIAGNHDAHSRISRHLRLPDNVRQLSAEEPETVLLQQIGVALHGQSFARPAVTEDLAARYPPPAPGLFNIGLLHTSADGLLLGRIEEELQPLLEAEAGRPLGLRLRLGCSDRLLGALVDDRDGWRGELRALAAPRA